MLRSVNKWLQGKGYRNDIDNLAIIELISNKVELNSDIQRSFAQYKAQLILYENSYKINLLKLIMIPLAFMVFIIALFIGVFYSFKKMPVKEDKIISLLPSKNFIPDALYGKNIEEKSKGIFFTLGDYFFLSKIYFKYLYHPYFFVKIAYYILNYSRFQKSYCQVLVSNEYSFVSSALSSYFRSNNVIVSNCMHGDKLINIRDSFCSYDFLYVWDKDYVKIFEANRIEAVYIVSGCKALILEVSKGCVEKNCITYFMQGGESNEQLAVIKDKLIILAGFYQVKYIKVRRHPRYYTSGLFDFFEVENIDTEELGVSINKSKVVCAKYSTVLFQVYKTKLYFELYYPLVLLDLCGWNVPDEYIMLNKSDGLF